MRQRGRYILRRMALAVVVIVGVSIITFVISRVVPSDPARTWVGVGTTSRYEDLLRAREELGLNLPLYQQYFRYVGKLMRGDLGMSFKTKGLIINDIRTRLPATIELVLFTLILSIIVGVPMGVLSAQKRNSLFDHFSRVVSIAGTAMPSFWVGLVLLILFFSKLKLLPAGGRVGQEIILYHPVDSLTGMYLIDTALTGNWVAFRSAVRHIILPGLTLSFYPVGLIARMTRSNMIEILNEKYILAARAAGLPTRTILFRLALRNALIPILNITGMMLVAGITATLVVEVIFTWPGLGSYINNAVLTLDFPVIMAVTTIVTILYVVVNLAVDLLQTAVDPRVSLE